MEDLNLEVVLFIYFLNSIGRLGGDGTKLKYYVRLLYMSIAINKNLIKKVRLSHGLSMSDCAEIVHKEYVTWTRYESGSLPMRLPTWELFCYKLAVPPGRLSVIDARMYSYMMGKDND